MYVCSCFGITEQQVKQHAESGRCTPRQVASACKAGTDCGSCVRRIQALLGRGAPAPAAGARPTPVPGPPACAPDREPAPVDPPAALPPAPLPSAPLPRRAA